MMQLKHQRCFHITKKSNLRQLNRFYTIQMIKKAYYFKRLLYNKPNVYISRSLNKYAEQAQPSK
jgi:hypothetical protein